MRVFAQVLQLNIVIGEFLYLVFPLVVLCYFHTLTHPQSASGTIINDEQLIKLTPAEMRTEPFAVEMFIWILFTQCLQTQFYTQLEGYRQ